MAGIIKSGWLSKEGNTLFAGWKERWFVLRGSAMEYYESASKVKIGDGRELKGKIDLKKCLEVRLDPNGLNFSILTAERNWKLKAFQKIEATDWVEKIRAIALKGFGTVAKQDTIVQIASNQKTVSTRLPPSLTLFTNQGNYVVPSTTGLALSPKPAKLLLRLVDPLNRLYEFEGLQSKLGVKPEDGTLYWESTQNSISSNLFKYRVRIKGKCVAFQNAMTGLYLAAVKGDVVCRHNAEKKKLLFDQGVWFMCDPPPIDAKKVRESLVESRLSEAEKAIPWAYLPKEFSLRASDGSFLGVRDGNLLSGVRRGNATFAQFTSTATDHPQIVKLVDFRKKYLRLSPTGYPELTSEEHCDLFDCRLVDLKRVAFRSRRLDAWLHVVPEKEQIRGHKLQKSIELPDEAIFTLSSKALSAASGIPSVRLPARFRLQAPNGLFVSWSHSSDDEKISKIETAITIGHGFDLSASSQIFGVCESFYTQPSGDWNTYFLALSERRDRYLAADKRKLTSSRKPYPWEVIFYSKHSISLRAVLSSEFLTGDMNNIDINLERSTLCAMPKNRAESEFVVVPRLDVNFAPRHSRPSDVRGVLDVQEKIAERKNLVSV